MEKKLESKLEEFLSEKGMLEDADAMIIKCALTLQLQAELIRQNLSKSVLAARMGVSIPEVERILNPTEPSSLLLLVAAARALQKRLDMKLVADRDPTIPLNQTAR